MGIYNCVDTLSESIESIIAQTFTDWELIMCDDGSTDDTYDLAMNYSNKHKNITVLRNEKNMGLNYTLNKCLQQASGVYIARMDGDDISLPDRFEKEVALLDGKKDIAIVSTCMEHFDEAGIWGYNYPKANPEPCDFLKGTPFCHAPSMVRKSAYDMVEGYTVDKRLLRVEDYHLWVKMYSKGLRGVNLQEVLYQMRDDRDAAKRRKFKFRINEARVIIKAVDQLGFKKKYYIYALRPLIVGLLPLPFYNLMHRMRLMNTTSI